MMRVSARYCAIQIVVSGSVPHRKSATNKERASGSHPCRLAQQAIDVGPVKTRLSALS